MGGFSLSEDTYGGEYEMPDGTRVYVSSDQPSEASEDMPHAGGIKPNNQPSPAPAGNTQGIIVPQTAPEASGAGNSAPTPEPTEEEEGWWGSWGSALVHGTLDVVGLIPVVGEVADGVNAVLYLAEGKKAEALISMLAMAPFGGQAATVAKLGMKGAEATKAAGKATAEAGAKATREGAEAGAEQASKRTTTGKDGGHIDGPKKQGENEGVTGEVPNKKLTAQLDRVRAEGHALERHGGAVTDEQLYVRARTGVAPDGSKARRGYTPTSTAFNSDELLVKADDFLRNNHLDDAIKNAEPGALRIKVSADTGGELGRGYIPVGKKTGLSGPLQKVDGLTNVEAWYVYDPAKNIWKTNTIYPIPSK